MVCRLDRVISPSTRRDRRHRAVVVEVRDAADLAAAAAGIPAEADETVVAPEAVAAIAGKTLAHHRGLL